MPHRIAGHDVTYRRWTWVLLLAGASFVFSLALACATPFAALAALGALVLKKVDAFAVAILAWLINQAVGFGLLGYLTDPMTLAWGLAIGLSAVAAAAAAMLTVQAFVLRGILLCALLTWAAALGAQQLVIYLATFRLPSDPAAFAPSVLLGIAWTNALAFVVLAALQILGAKLRLSAPLIGLERFQTG
ncbi:MAG: hypothetical protein AAF637_16905 [Pseudomonadota bacterium]